MIHIKSGNQELITANLTTTPVTQRKDLDEEISTISTPFYTRQQSQEGYFDDNKPSRSNTVDLDEHPEVFVVGDYSEHANLQSREQQSLKSKSNRTKSKSPANDLTSGYNVISANLTGASNVTITTVKPREDQGMPKEGKPSMNNNSYNPTNKSLANSSQMDETQPAKSLSKSFESYTYDRKLSLEILENAKKPNLNKSSVLKTTSKEILSNKQNSSLPLKFNPEIMFSGSRGTIPKSETNLHHIPDDLLEDDGITSPFGWSDMTSECL